MRAVAFVFLITLPLAAQTQVRLPRGANGKPDLNGIWQAMTTANWDIEPHEARPGVTQALGALAAEPSGQGIVEGGKIP